MGAVRIIILVGAAIAAIVLMFIVGNLVNHKPAATVVAAAPAKPVTRVVVAAHDLVVGTNLTLADLTWQPWPADAVNPSFITDGHAAEAKPTDGAAVVVSQANRVAASVAAGGHSPMDGLVGAIVRTPILANEPVTNAKVVRGGAGGYMAVVLQPGMRAMAIPVSATTDAGGFILPGDRVDILQARQSDLVGSVAHPFVASTLAHNIRVLAIDQTAQPPKAGGQSVLGSVATIEVTPADAELIAVAKAQGEMLLTLRAYTDSRGASGGDSNRAGLVHIVRNGVATDISVTP
jgi:pilus assembly protein CpaB